MTDSLDLHLVVHGRGATAQWFRTRATLMLQPPGAEHGFSLQAWPLGPAGELHVAAGTNELLFAALEVDDGAGAVAFDPPPGAVEADSVTALLAVGASATVARTAPAEGVAWNVAVVDGIAATRWYDLADGLVLVGTDDGSRLATLAFRTEVPIPALRPVRLRSVHGWDAIVRARFAMDATPVPTGRGVSLQRGHDPGPGTWTEPVGYEDAPSLDGTAHAAIEAGELTTLDVACELGAVPLPGSDASTDALDVQLRWPLADPRAILDDEAGTVRIDLVDEVVEQWVLVDGTILAGLGAGDELVAVVLAQVVREDQDPMMHPFGMLPDGEQPTQEQLHEHVQVSMQAQHVQEHARLERFAAAPTMAALGPVDPPADAPLGMRLVEGVFGPDDPATGVELTWGDPFARLMPAGDRSQPVVVVSHRRTEAMPMPPGADALEFDEDVSWVMGEQMLRRQWAAEDDPSLAPDLAETMALAGPESHRRAMRTIAERVEPTTLVVDGEPLPAQRWSADGAFAVRAERDGWTTSVRATGIGDAVPELAPVADLAPFAAGQVAADERMLAWHAQMAEQARSLPAASPEADAIRRAVQRLGHGLAHATGGDPRLVALARVAQLQMHFEACDRDGTVALAGIHVSLPRPDGSGVSFAVGIEHPYWEHGADEIRTRAAQQPPREHQGEYELQFRVLVERVDGDEYRIVTDVAALVDEHVGGIQRLLQP